MCMKCVDDIYEYYYQQMEDSAKACRRTCSKLDIYYDDRALHASSATTNRTLMAHYMSKLSSNQSYVRSFDDTIYEMSVDGKTDIEILGADAGKPSDGVPDEVRQFWGDGFTPKQYEEMQGYYDRWTDGKSLTGADEIGLYRNIAFTEWQIMNAARKGAKTEQLTQALNSLLGKTSVSDKKGDELRAVGVKIRDWEMERPVPEPAPEFKDVDGIVRYITVWFLGHFCKMFGIKNSYNRMYEEEMNKYKVERPEYIDADDEESVFDAIFGGKKGGDGS